MNILTNIAKNLPLLNRKAVLCTLIMKSLLLPLPLLAADIKSSDLNNKEQVNTLDPRPITTKNFPYPRQAFYENREGWVVLAVDIDDKGLPYNVDVIDAKPPRVFDRSALRSMSNLRFEPAIVNGQPVSVKNKLYKVVYSLTDGDGD